MSETISAKPVWLDVANCGTSEYTAPPGYSDVHADWTSNLDGSIVAIGGHVHDIEYDDTANCPNWPNHCDFGGGTDVTLEVVGGPSTDYYGPLPKPTHSGLNGATACRGKAYYGTSYGNANGFAGHMDTVSSCGILADLPAGAQPEAYPSGAGYSPLTGYPVRKGQVLRLHSEYQNNTGVDRTDVMGILTPWIAKVPYETPVGASPMRVPLVPAFGACNSGSANSTHGPPLNFKSCSPPSPASNTVRTGNGAVGSAWVIVCNTGATVSVCNESSPGFTAAMQPDVRMFGAIRDVQCRLTGTPSGCSAGSDYNPNGSTGPYTTICNNVATCGNDGRPNPFCAPGASSSSACIAGTDATLSAGLGNPTGVTVNPTAQCGTVSTCLAFASKFVGHGLRVTDSYNCDPALPVGDPDRCPATTASRTATMADIKFPVPLDCITSASASLGSTCGVNTTANALVPGWVVAGKKAVIEFGEVQLLDSGSDGTRGNSDDQRFATQGIYLP